MRCRTIWFAKKQSSCRGGDGGKEEEAFMQMLVITVCILVAIWIIILFGSRFFGPR